MTSDDIPLERLAAHARETRVVVIGAGIAGLVAAYQCAKVGIRVVVLEQSDRIGGSIRTAEVGGLTLDVGAESYATRGGHVRALIEELGLGDEIVLPAPGGAWVVGLPGSPGAAPLPKDGVLGIPENPFADDVRRVIGWRGAWRAYVDRLRPPLTIGHERSLGRLVRTRMGAAVLDRLVAPVTTGVYSSHPDDIDVDVAAPGLNSALTRAGSLSGAVALLRGERAASAAGSAASAAPGAAIEGIDGGVYRLVEELRRRLDDLEADVRTDASADFVERTMDGWKVSVSSRSAGISDDPISDAVIADAVIMATPEAAARRLLGDVVPDLGTVALRQGPDVHVVTLVLDAPQLDAKPRGTGVLTVAGTRPAKALTHSTAKWPWLADRVPAGRHVVRVSFGSQGEPPATAGLSAQDAAALALSEASALLGVPLAPDQVVDARLEPYGQAQPASVIGQHDAAVAARASIQAVDGLAATGAWLSGTGLAQVVPDATAAAERVRQSALWG